MTRSSKLAAAFLVVVVLVLACYVLLGRNRPPTVSVPFDDQLVSNRYKRVDEQPLSDSESVYCGVTNDGQRFRMIDRHLSVPLADDPRQESVFELPHYFHEAPPEGYPGWDVRLLRWSVQVSADRRHLLCSGQPGMCVWETGPPIKRLHVWYGPSEPHQPRLTAYRASPDGRLVCVYTSARYSIDGHYEVLLLRDVETGTDLKQFTLPANVSQVQVAWSGDSRQLAACCRRLDARNTQNVDGLTVWNVDTGAKVFAIAGDFDRCELSGDGSRLLAISSSEQVAQLTPVSTFSVHDARNGAKLAARSVSWLTDAIFSPDGKWVAVSSGAAVQVLSADTLREKWSSNCPGRVRQVAFKPDSNELAARWLVINEIVGGSAGVKAWDVASGAPVLDARVSHLRSQSLAFTSRGEIAVDCVVFAPSEQ